MRDPRNLIENAALIAYREILRDDIVRVFLVLLPRGVVIAYSVEGGEPPPTTSHPLSTLFAWVYINKRGALSESAGEKCEIAAGLRGIRGAASSAGGDGYTHEE